MKNYDFGLHCPNCGEEYECSCKTCNQIRGRELKWKVIGDDIKQCPCGFSATIDWWKELEMMIWERMKELKNPSRPEPDIKLFVRKGSGLSRAFKSMKENR